VAGIFGSVAGLGGTCGERKELTSGAHMAVTRERKGVTARMHKSEEKMDFGECAKASRTGWVEWEAAVGEARRVGVARVGPARLDPRRVFKWKLIFKFQINFDLARL
jgi:hypothetical protein